MAVSLNGDYTFTKIASAAAFISDDNNFNLPGTHIRIDAEYPQPRHSILVLSVNKKRTGINGWVRTRVDPRVILYIRKLKYMYMIVVHAVSLYFDVVEM